MTEFGSGAGGVRGPEESPVLKPPLEGGPLSRVDKGIERVVEVAGFSTTGVGEQKEVPVQRKTILGMPHAEEGGGLSPSKVVEEAKRDKRSSVHGQSLLSRLFRRKVGADILELQETVNEMFVPGEGGVSRIFSQEDLDVLAQKKGKAQGILSSKRTLTHQEKQILNDIIQKCEPEPIQCHAYIVCMMKIQSGKHLEPEDFIKLRPVDRARLAEDLAIFFSTHTLSQVGEKLAENAKQILEDLTDEQRAALFKNVLLTKKVTFLQAWKTCSPQTYQRAAQGPFSERVKGLDQEMKALERARLSEMPSKIEAVLSSLDELADIGAQDLELSNQLVARFVLLQDEKIQSHIRSNEALHQHFGQLLGKLRKNDCFLVVLATCAPEKSFKAIVEGAQPSDMARLTAKAISLPELHCVLSLANPRDARDFPGVILEIQSCAQQADEVETKILLLVCQCLKERVDLEGKNRLDLEVAEKAIHAQRMSLAKTEFERAKGVVPAPGIFDRFTGEKTKNAVGTVLGRLDTVVDRIATCKDIEEVGKAIAEIEKDPLLIGIIRRDAGLKDKFQLTKDRFDNKALEVVKGRRKLLRDGGSWTLAEKIAELKDMASAVQMNPSLAPGTKTFILNGIRNTIRILFTSLEYGTMTTAELCETHKVLETIAKCEEELLKPRLDTVEFRTALSTQGVSVKNALLAQPHQKLVDRVETLSREVSILNSLCPDRKDKIDPSLSEEVKKLLGRVGSDVVDEAGDRETIKKMLSEESALSSLCSTSPLAEKMERARVLLDLSSATNYVEARAVSQKLRSKFNGSTLSGKRALATALLDGVSTFLRLAVEGSLPHFMAQGMMSHEGSLVALEVGASWQDLGVITEANSSIFDNFIEDIRSKFTDDELSSIKKVLTRRPDATVDDVAVLVSYYDSLNIPPPLIIDYLKAAVGGASLDISRRTISEFLQKPPTTYVDKEICENNPIILSFLPASFILARIQKLAGNATEAQVTSLGDVCECMKERPDVDAGKKAQALRTLHERAFKLNQEKFERLGESISAEKVEEESAEKVVKEKISLLTRQISLVQTARNICSVLSSLENIGKKGEWSEGSLKADFPQVEQSFVAATTRIVTWLSTVLPDPTPQGREKKISVLRQIADDVHKSPYLSPETKKALLSKIWGGISALFSSVNIEEQKIEEILALQLVLEGIVNSPALGTILTDSSFRRTVDESGNVTSAIITFAGQVLTKFNVQGLESLEMKALIFNRKVLIFNKIEKLLSPEICSVLKREITGNVEAVLDAMIAFDGITREDRLVNILTAENSPLIAFCANNGPLERKRALATELMCLCAARDFDAHRLQNGRGIGPASDVARALADRADTLDRSSREEDKLQASQIRGFVDTFLLKIHTGEIGVCSSLKIFSRGNKFPADCEEWCPAGLPEIRDPILRVLSWDSAVTLRDVTVFLEQRQNLLIPEKDQKLADGLFAALRAVVAQKRNILFSLIPFHRPDIIIKFQMEKLPPDITEVDRGSISKVLRQSPDVTLHDVAVLVRYRASLGVPSECIFDYINQTRTPAEKFTDAEFLEVSQFFNEIPQEDVDLAIEMSLGKTSRFRRKQLYAESLVMEHRPPGFKTEESAKAVQGSDISWLQRQLQIRDADSTWRTESTGMSHRIPMSSKELQELPVVTVKDTLFPDSTQVQEVPGCEGAFDRAWALKHPQASEPGNPTFTYSSLVPKAMMVHLFRDQGDSAMGVKYQEVEGKTPATDISNMESLFRHFVCGVAKVKMGADVFHAKAIGKLDPGKVREILLSCQVHPDCELANVFLELAALTDEEIVGEPLRDDFDVPSREERAGWMAKEREDYDKKLLKHLIFHLYPGGVRPAKSEATAKGILNESKAKEMLEAAISDPNPDTIPGLLKDKYVEVNGKVISLELFFTTYLHQLRNEFAILEAGHKPYIYTIMPPAIFAQQFSAPLMNRLQCLAFRYIGQDRLPNLRYVVPNTFGDEPLLLGLYENVFPGRDVRPMKEVYDENGKFLLGDELAERFPQGIAKVDHNNGDSFGRNLRTEHVTSLDGAVGSCGDGSSVFDEGSPSLLAHAQCSLPRARTWSVDLKGATTGRVVRTIEVIGARLRSQDMSLEQLEEVEAHAHYAQRRAVARAKGRRDSTIGKFLAEKSVNRLFAKTLQDIQQKKIALKEKSWKDLSGEELDQMRVQFSENDCIPVDASGVSLLHYAAEKGAILLLRALLRTKQNVAIPVDRAGETPLDYAIAADQEKAVTKLCQLDDYRIHADNQGKTPLHHAAEKGDEVAVALLIEYKADVCAVDKDGKTALHYAARAGSAALVKALIAAGAKIDAVDNDGRTPLHDVLKVLKSQNQEALDALIELGGDVGVQDKDGKTPLHHAVAGESSSMAKKMIERATPEQLLLRDTQGNNAFLVAIQKDKLDLLPEMGLKLSGKKDLRFAEFVNAAGDSPWHVLARKGASLQGPALDLWLKELETLQPPEGINPWCMPNAEGLTPVQIAMKTVNMPVMAKLFASIPKSDELPVDLSLVPQMAHLLDPVLELLQDLDKQERAPASDKPDIQERRKQIALMMYFVASTHPEVFEQKDKEGKTFGARLGELRAQGVSIPPEIEYYATCVDQVAFYVGEQQGVLEARLEEIRGRCRDATTTDALEALKKEITLASTSPLHELPKEISSALQLEDDEEGNNPWHTIAKEQDFKYFNECINPTTGKKLLAKNVHGLTPIHVAIQAGNTTLFHVLCDPTRRYENVIPDWDDPSLRTDDGKPLLHFAVDQLAACTTQEEKKKIEEIIILLIAEHPSLIDQKDARGQTCKAYVSTVGGVKLSEGNVLSGKDARAKAGFLRLKGSVEKSKADYVDFVGSRLIEERKREVQAL